MLKICRQSLCLDRTLSGSRLSGCDDIAPTMRGNEVVGDPTTSLDFLTNSEPAQAVADHGGN